MSVTIMPNLPMNIVNRIIRDADILDKRKNIRRFIYNKISGNHEFRAKFRRGYLKKFATVEKCLLFKLRNPPKFTLILPATASSPFRELIRFRDCVQTKEEREATVSRMKDAMIVKFPQKTHQYADGSGEFEYKYSYCSFDNGCVFIESNTYNDEDDYYLSFWRGYICLDGRTFPIFDMPESSKNYLETPDQNPFGIDNCTQIRYLEKELGQKVRIPSGSQSFCYVYDEEKGMWSYNQEYNFTEKEARFLVPFYEEPDYDEYYSD